MLIRTPHDADIEQPILQKLTHMTGRLNAVAKSAMLKCCEGEVRGVREMVIAPAEEGAISLKR
jgi:hypothetical protein